MDGDNNLKPHSGGYKAQQLSILIVDDHPIVRYGIMRLLESESDIHIIADTSSCKTAREILYNDEPVLLLMDMQLRDNCAHKLVMSTGELGLDTKILVYSAQISDWQITDALRHGVHGYITKNAEPGCLREAIRVVAGGGSYIDPSIASKVIGQVGRMNERRASHSRQLTQRESAVLKGVALGKRSREIADELCITESTVKYHLSSMYNKLRVHNRAEAVGFAFEHGLIK
jgi:DNA-binding NarL/FixJ family response regulator